MRIKLRNFIVRSIAIVLTILGTNLAQAQNCEVKMEEIAETYKGKCKRGLAHGKGKATGIDSYEGEFKKGLPDGDGVYKFQNGNIYTGEFDKGMKQGKGQMTFANGELPALDGYWIDDEYAGKDKKVYELIDRSTSIKNVKFRRIDGSENKITFKFASQGKPVKSTNVVFESPVAAEVNKNDFEAEYAISEFPMKGNIRFSAAALKNANGTSDYVDGQAEIEVKFKGNWEITIEINTN